MSLVVNIEDIDAGIFTNDLKDDGFHTICHVPFYPG
jgi:hypothetical protein